MLTRVLLVEDDPNLRGFLRKAFREEGFLVDDAASGGAGLALALEKDFDCVVLDRMLPGLDGLELLRQLRARGKRTPVLMLTARGDTPDRVRGLEAGADDYLPKPFDLPELLARLQALIRRSRFAAEDAVMRVGALSLDPLGRKVTLGDQRADLTPREFALLEYFMRNVNRTLSRSRIAEAVWNYQFDTETNVVDVYVNYLRKKLAPLTDGTGIVTVRGVGYRLEGP
jgi:two-component system OmpR family response regulator